MIKLLNKIGISLRLLLISCVYMIPIGTLTVFLEQTIKKDISFATFEKMGNQYQLPLENLLSELGNHRILSKNRELSSDDKKRIYELEANIDKGFIDLVSVDQEIGPDLQFTDEGLRKRHRDNLRPELVKQKWDAIKSTPSNGDKKDLETKYLAIIADIRGMIAHAGDTSNLILDPDLDSYYMMDVTLIALPQNQDRVSAILSYIKDLPTKGALTSDVKTQLAVYAQMLEEADLGRITVDVQTALNEDPNFYGLSPSFAPKVNAVLDDYKSATNDFIEQIRALSSSSESDVAMIGMLIETGQRVYDSSFRFWNTAVQELNKLFDYRLGSFRSKMKWMLISSFLLLMPVLLLVFFVTKSISRPLNIIMKRLNSGADHISDVANQVLDSSNSLAKSSGDQAAAVQETVASTAEMSSMISQTAEYAKESLGLANKVSERTEEGGRIMERMVAAMESIQQANNQLQEMANIINEISTKTAVINDIVFKTQLLSFNASIEAARAGQHGRGFAVVAEEVGNLAEMSGNAAKEIQVLLDDSKKQVNDIVEGTRERVTEGQKVSREALETFSDIAKDVYNISSQIQSINDATREQESGVKQTTIAMNQMDGSSQDNNQVALQASQLANQLTVEASKLIQITKAMKVLVVGSKSANKPPRSTEDEETDIMNSSFTENKNVKTEKTKSHKNGKQKNTKIIELNRPLDPNESTDSIANKLINRGKSFQSQSHNEEIGFEADDPSFQ